MSFINFHKMHGCGNDFVIIDNRELHMVFKLNYIRSLSDRRKSIGCDQIIILEKYQDFDCLMRIYNADGSEVGNCGNAARCVTKLLAEELNKETIKIKTITSQMEGHYINADSININKEKVTNSPNQIIIDNVIGFKVDVGNPHIVFFIGSFDEIDIDMIGPKIENHHLFPNRTNVNFAKIIDHKTIELKTWERGTGKTLACGTGACATAFVAIYDKKVENRVNIIQEGGNLLIEFRQNELFMQGEAIYVFNGKISL